MRTSVRSVLPRGPFRTVRSSSYRAAIANVQRIERSIASVLAALRRRGVPLHGAHRVLAVRLLGSLRRDLFAARRAAVVAAASRRPARSYVSRRRGYRTVYAAAR